MKHLGEKWIQMELWVRDDLDLDFACFFLSVFLGVCHCFGTKVKSIPLYPFIFRKGGEDVVQDGLEGVDRRMIELDDPLVVLTCCDLKQHWYFAMENPHVP